MLSAEILASRESPEPLPMTSSGKSSARVLSQPTIVLPASAISYAPFGDSVFVVADMKTEDGQTYRGVRQQLVKVGPSRGDQVSIISGVKAGEEVVTSGLFKLRNGAAVQINNAVRPANDPAPKPGNS